MPPQITKNIPTVEKSSIENIPAVDSTLQVDSGHLVFEHVSKQSIPREESEHKVKKIFGTRVTTMLCKEKGCSPKSHHVPQPIR